MKKYRLIKDYPGIKIGAIAVYNEKENIYDIDPKYITGDNFFPRKDLPVNIYKPMVENNTEWFEEIFEPTEKQIKIQELLENVIDKFEVNKEKGSIKIKQIYLDHFSKNVESLFNEDHLKGEVKTTPEAKFRVKTEDGFDCTDGDRIYGIAIQASGVDQWREEILPFKTPISENRVWFKNKEKANEYLIAYKPCLTLAEVANRVCLAEISINYFKEIIKSRI